MYRKYIILFSFLHGVQIRHTTSDIQDSNSEALSMI